MSGISRHFTYNEVIFFALHKNRMLVRHYHHVRNKEKFPSELPKNHSN